MTSVLIAQKKEKNNQRSFSGFCPYISLPIEMLRGGFTAASGLAQINFCYLLVAVIYLGRGLFKWIAADWFNKPGSQPAANCTIIYWQKPHVVNFAWRGTKKRKKERKRCCAAGPRSVCVCEGHSSPIILINWTTRIKRYQKIWPNHIILSCMIVENLELHSKTWGNVCLVGYFFVVTVLPGNKSWNPDYFPFKRGHICKKTCICGMSLGAAPMKDLPNICKRQRAFSFFFCSFSLGGLDDWSLKKQDIYQQYKKMNFFIWQTGALVEGNTRSHDDPALQVVSDEPSVNFEDWVWTGTVVIPSHHNSVGAAVAKVLSVSSPHFDGAIQVL